MTDTPRVPSEATTGTPPAPETLASPGTVPASEVDRPAHLPTPVAPATEPEARPLAAQGDAGPEAAQRRPDEAPDDVPGDVPGDEDVDRDVGADVGAGVGAAVDAAVDAAAPVPADAPAAAAQDDPAAARPEAESEAPAEPPGATPPTRPDLSPAACAALLAEHFPALFGAAPRPLKLRIQADIQVRAPGVFTRKALSVFLHRYTTTNAYLNALVKAPQRVDLDGADAGEIADEHRMAASEELARRRAIHETRRREARAADNAARRAAPRAAMPAGEGEAGAAPAAGTAVAMAAAAGPAGAAEGPGRQGTPGTPRPPRPSRPPMPARDGQGTGPRDAREPRRDRPPGQRPEQGPPARAGQHQTGRGDRGERHPPRHPGPVPAHSPPSAAPHAGPAASSSPQHQPAWSEAERERAALLRAYEGSTLTRANFCVLKRIDEATLEAQLLLAKQERAQRPPAPPRPEVRNEARADFRPGSAHASEGRQAREGRAGGRTDNSAGPRRPRPSTPGR